MRATKRTTLILALLNNLQISSQSFPRMSTSTFLLLVVVVVRRLPLLAVVVAMRLPPLTDSDAFATDSCSSVGAGDGEVAVFRRWPLSTPLRRLRPQELKSLEELRWRCCSRWQSGALMSSCQSGWASICSTSRCSIQFFSCETLSSKVKQKGGSSSHDDVNSGSDNDSNSNNHSTYNSSRSSRHRINNTSSNHGNSSRDRASNNATNNHRNTTSDSKSSNKSRNKSNNNSNNNRAALPTRLGLAAAELEATKPEPQLLSRRGR